MIELTDKLMVEIDRQVAAMMEKAGESDGEEGVAWAELSDEEKQESREAVQTVLNAIEQASDVVLVDREVYQRLVRVNTLAKRLVPALWGAIQPAVAQLVATAQAAGIFDNELPTTPEGIEARDEQAKT